MAVQMLAPEILAQIKAIQIRTQGLVTESLAGDYESAFRGRGMEFEEVREYQPGDDIRHIDWNVTARMSAPFVKQYREERELSVVLLVDVSSSGRFGSRRKTKSEVAAEVAALLAYTAIKSNDKVGLIVFSDEVELYIPPKKGRGHVWRVIREILTHHPRRKGTDIEAALDYLGRVIRRRAVVFLISDFLDATFEESLRIAARRHDLTAVTVTDPRESELPRIGLLELQDSESGEMIVVDTSDERLRRGLLERTAVREEALAGMFRSHGVGELRVETHRSPVEPIVRFFRRRERARERWC
jgi:uncharacterized protein (DUF58 family)